MPTAKKEAVVAELKDLVSRSTIVVSAEYRGLSVKELTTLRKSLRDAGVEARVVKNRLFQIAASQAGLELAGTVVDGPSMVIFGFGDIVTPSKAIADYQRVARNAFAPKKVFTLHGFAADFAATLRRLGFDAQALSEPEQLELSLDDPLELSAANGSERTPRPAPESFSSTRTP